MAESADPNVADGRFPRWDHTSTNHQDLYIVPLAGDHKPVPLVATPADESPAAFSPDSRWIAYSSDESGQREVYVRDFAPDRVPAIGAFKIQISTAGGDKPRWSRNGKDLYYLAANRKLMAVPIAASSTFSPDVPTPLFETNVTGYIPYDVSPDGRFLINTVSDGGNGGVQTINVFLNWAEALKR